MDNNFKRRSVTLPAELDKIINIKFKESNHSFMNQFLVELLENGLIKMIEKDDDNNQNNKIISMLELICDKLKIE